MTMTHYVFVYGTLRRGELNHRLLRAATCAAEQASVIGTLHDTDYGYPALKLEGTHRVYGELYWIDKQILISLDMLEGFYGDGDVRNLYDRVEVMVQTDTGSVQAWVYVYDAEKVADYKLILSGDWKTYRLYERGLSNTILYFSYGSCMDLSRFQAQGVEHLFKDVIGRGQLSGYNLQFTRRAVDGGRADIVESGGVVEGKLYRVPHEAIEYLWRREGVQSGIYRPASIKVFGDNEEVYYEALTFVVVDKEEETAPPAWYKEEILRGAESVVSSSYYEWLKDKLVY